MSKSHTTKITIQYYAGAQALHSLSVPVNPNATLKDLIKFARQGAGAQNATHWRLIINSAASSLQPLQ